MMLLFEEENKEEEMMMSEALTSEVLDASNSTLIRAKCFALLQRMKREVLRIKARITRRRITASSSSTSKCACTQYENG